MTHHIAHLLKPQDNRLDGDADADAYEFVNMPWF